MRTTISRPGSPAWKAFCGIEDEMPNRTLADLKRVAEATKGIKFSNNPLLVAKFYDTFTPELCAALVDVAMSYTTLDLFTKREALHALLQEGDE